MQHPTPLEIPDSPPVALSALGGVVQSYQWMWKDKPVTVVYETIGEGAVAVLQQCLQS
jgi:hypothetical protein